MNLKVKSKLWMFTYPFAHKNYTLVGDTLYYPKGKTPSKRIIDHEEIHSRQMKRVGTFKFYFLYLFALPLVFNPWRWKWEAEAYREGQGYSEDKIEKLLKSYRYGWLI